MKSLRPYSILTLLTILLTSVFSTLSAQNRLYVKKGATGDGTSWENALGEISTAIAQISNSYTSYEIWVAKGIYHPGSSVYDRFVLTTNTQLYGGFEGNETSITDRDIAQNKTIISGDVTNDQTASSNTLFFLNGVSGVVIDGFTITGANTYNTTHNSSSAIQLYDTYYVTLSNLVIENNHAFGNGGGIVIQNGRVAIHNTIIRNNETKGPYSGSGGGIHSYGADLTITDTQIQNNKAHSGEGGGIRFQPIDQAGNLSIKNTIIENNYASSQGGGIYLAYGQNQNQVTSERLIIRNNAAGVAGGGFASRYAFARYMRDVLIEQNTAPIGGGIYLDAPRSGSIYTAKIRNNTATNKGGGIYLKIENNFSYNEGFLFYSSMISRNSATNGGSEIYYENAQNNGTNKLGLINCLVESATTSSNHILQEGGTNNTIEIYNTIVAGTARIAASTPYNAQASLINGDISTTNGNISGDFLNFPIFKSRNPADSTFFHPITGSLLHDAGRGYTHWISLDLAGKERYAGPQLDIGPYEIQEASLLQAPFRLYVKKGATGTGFSWDSPMGELSEALALAASQTTRFSESNPLHIYVAKGTYTPAYSASNFTASGTRNTFLIPKNVQIYGGFDPDYGIKTLEHIRTVADFEATILSGDINKDDTRTGRTTSLTLNNYTDNALHVVTILDELGVGSLQGVKIVGGNATSIYTNQTINNHEIRGGDGAAIWMSASSTPITFNNVYFEHNAYTNSVVHAARPLIINNSKFRLNNGTNNAILQTALPITVRNTLIEGNYTTSKRDFFLSGSSTTAPSIFENLTVVDNGYWGTSATFSFIEASHYAAIQVRNGVFYPMVANSAQTYNFFNVYGLATQSISNSVVQRWNNTTDGNLNGNAYNVASLFRNPSQQDYRPAHTSALINAGLTSSYTGEEKDLFGNVRVNGTIDIGAYEWSESPIITNFDGDVATYLTGTSTYSFIDINQDALLTDSDTPFYAGGQLTVTITNGTLSEHSLDITPSVDIYVTNAPSNTNWLYYASQQIGTVIGIGTNKLTVHFNVNASNAAITALLRQIGYRSTNSDLNTTRFTVQTKLLDGAGGEGNYTSYIDVIRATVTISNLPATTDYFIDSRLVQPISSQVAIEVPHEVMVTSATISFTQNFDASTDLLALSGTHSINAQFNASTGVLLLTGAGTSSEWQQALRSVTYQTNVVNLPGQTAKTVIITLTTDLLGSKTSNPITLQLKHNPIVGPNINHTIYVDKRNQSPIQNGRNWETAITELADALKWVYDNKVSITAENPIKVFVAKGTYLPLDREQTNTIMVPPYGYETVLVRNSNNRDNTFLIPANVEIYGGFDPVNGIITMEDERILMDENNGTILSGDYLQNDVVTGSAASLQISNNTENAKQIIKVVGAITTKLNGLTIKGAYTVDYETGGGIHSSNTSSLDLENLVILANRGYSTAAITHYGGIANASNLLIKNNIIHENFPIVSLTRFSANTIGKSVWKNIEITGNATRFLNNSQYSNSTGGTLLTRNFNLELLNSKIHNNTASTPAANYITSATVHMTDSQVRIANTLLFSNVAPSLFYGTNVNLTLLNSTAINNSMNQFVGTGSIAVRNSIVIRTNAQIAYSVLPLSLTDAKHSLIQGMAASEENKVLDGTTISFSNLFNNSNANDFSLRNDATSNARTSETNPLINAGNITYYDVNIMGRYDLVGNERVRDGQLDLGPYELQRGDSPLPVSLAYFKATLENEQAVLHWQTIAEENFSHFEVEHSIDGKTFNTIGTVIANQEQLYSFTSILSPTTNYYRLKMVDLDGSYSYSKLVSVVGKTEDEFRVYPNPVVAEQLLNVYLPVPSEVFLKDVTGKQIAVYSLAKGQSSIQLPKLAPGVYLLTNSLGNSLKLIVTQ